MPWGVGDGAVGDGFGLVRRVMVGSADAFVLTIPGQQLGLEKGLERNGTGRVGSSSSML